MKLKAPWGSRACRSGLLALLTITAALGTPWIASSAAQAGGADKPRPATFGDCPHENAGVHNGYDCEPAEESEEGGSTGSGGGTTGTGGGAPS